MSFIHPQQSPLKPFGQRKEGGAFGLRGSMNKRNLLLALALGLMLVLLFAVPATAASQLECKGELPGGYSFTEPTEITVSIVVSNSGDEEMPGPVKLYYPSLEQVEEFGSPTLAAGSSRNWEGTWKVSQAELNAGEIDFYVYYPVKDENGELKNKAKKLSFKISYTGSEPELNITRTILPRLAAKNQEVSIIYEIANVGAAEVTNVTIKENADISSTAGAIKSIQPGETGKYVFTAKMGTKDLTSSAAIGYKAGGKSYSASVAAETVKYGTPELTASLQADKKGGAPGDTVKLNLILKNTGKGDYTNIEVTDASLGTVFTGESVKAGSTIALEKDLTVTETTDLQFVVRATGADGKELETATGRVHVVATDPTKQVVLSVEAKADRSEVYSIPGGVVRFTITVRNESAVDVKNISVKAVDREVYSFDEIPSGQSRTVTRDMEISMAGSFQFTANAKDELGQVVTFASNVVPIAYAPPTPVPTEAPLVTPPAPQTKALPQATNAPQWINQTEQIANNAKWILAGIAGVLAVLLLIGAVRRGHKRSQSNKAMDHLEGANYRDYSAAPRRRRRNEVISGGEQPDESAGAPEEEPAKTEESGEMMAETLKRLYNESGSGAKEAAGEAAEAVEEAAEETAEAVKEDAENAAESLREASHRRRSSRS